LFLIALQRGVGNRDEGNAAPVPRHDYATDAGIGETEMPYSFDKWQVKQGIFYDTYFSLIFLMRLDFYER